jgi:predicted RNA-binding protein with RPS1 domain
MQTIKNNTISDLEWDALVVEHYHQKRIPNPHLLKKYGATVWNHDANAEEMYLLYEKGSPIESKEVQAGESRMITSIISVKDGEMIVSLSGMVDAVISLDKEKAFLKGLGLTPEEFVSWMKNTPGAHSAFLGTEGRKVIIEGIKPYVMASLSKGHFESLRNELYAQIKDPKNAYLATVISRNGGGFLVNVSGIDGFLPGSLAAANIVRDFDTMLGKQIYVMVEDLLKDAGTFVFSHKKYLNYILPSKIEELSLEAKYEGTITGTAKFGIFVEFNEIFTGLIHTSKMTPAMRDEFKAGAFTPGEKVSFWIKEITSDKKIILTDEDPTVRQKEIDEFKDKNLGIIRGGEVVSIQPFGTLVKLQKDIVGLISQKEIKTKKKKYSVGDHVMVTVERVHNDKIFLTIPNED